MKKSPASAGPGAPGYAPSDALDAGFVARIDAARGAGADDPDGRERVRRILLPRIAADSTAHHLTLPASDAGWKPFGPGVAIKVLHEQGGVMSYLLRLDPGAELPPHRHPIDEECVVLEGEVCVGALRIGAGGYHCGRQDVLHDRLHSPGGALVFLRGAAPRRAHVLG